MADVSSLQRLLRDKASQATESAVLNMVDELKANAPVGTGATRDETDYEPLSLGDLTSYRVFCPTPQGEYVEYGTAAHDIYGDPYLAFYWAKINKFMILNAKQTPVHNPGMSPKPWFHPITDQWNRFLSEAWS